MEQYKQGRRLTVGVDGDARFSDLGIVLSLPAETVKYRGEDIINQRKCNFIGDSLSDLKFRGRSAEGLLEEYSELVERYGEEYLSLIDADPESIEHNVIGILEWDDIM